MSKNLIEKLRTNTNENSSKLHVVFHLFLNKSILVFVILLISSGSIFSQETVRIPEPLMFDLVRGLGAQKGELEVNALAEFPITNASNRGVDWAPEIEYALFNNFAIEVELPLNNFELEAYKMAIQWTIGSSKNNKFIHGIQVLGEAYIHDEILELNFLYVLAYRFNSTWSAIGLFGVMLESGFDSPSKGYTFLLNASVFVDINEHTVVGMELNNTNPMIQKIDNNQMELLVLPQLHYEFDNGLSFQLGLGSRFAQNETNASFVLRLIKSF